MITNNKAVDLDQQAIQIQAQIIQALVEVEVTQLKVLKVAEVK
jgi:hypothetical protein